MVHRRRPKDRRGAEQRSLVSHRLTSEKPEPSIGHTCVPRTTACCICVESCALYLIHTENRLFSGSHKRFSYFTIFQGFFNRSDRYDRKSEKKTRLHWLQNSYKAIQNYFSDLVNSLFFLCIRKFFPTPRLFAHLFYRLFFLRLIAQFFTQIYMNCFVSS